MKAEFERVLLGGRGLPVQASLLQKLHLDGWLLLLLFILAISSLLMLYSASGKNIDLLLKQSSSFGIGLLAMLVIAQINPRFMARWALPAYCVGLVLLLIVEVSGHTAMGATRWINVGGVFRFQPSEFMKIIMPATIAWYMAHQPLPPRALHILVALGLIAAPFVLILLQPDLGTALLILVSGAFVLFMAGLQWRWIFGAVVGLVPICLVMWFFVLREYQRQRVLTFLDPGSDPLGTGWNIIQSKAAIGSGGIWGKGWLLGTQSHLDFLPESHTDFVIAALAEEFGMVGVCLLLLLYVLLVGRGLFIALEAQSSFGKLLAGSLIMTFFIYVFVNIGMVSGLLPVVGVPLPFISYGGTSLVTLMSSFGILMSIHTHRARTVRGS